MNFGKLLHFLNYTDRSYYDVYIPSKTAIKTEYVNNKKTDIQYILRVYENRILIAFRGTDSCRDEPEPVSPAIRRLTKAVPPTLTL